MKKVHSVIELERQASSVSTFSSTTGSITANEDQQQCPSSAHPDEDVAVPLEEKKTGQQQQQKPNLSSSSFFFFFDVLDVFISGVIFYIGFHRKDIFLPSVEHVMKRQAPYQLIPSTNDDVDSVILDFTLNHPLIKPATIPGKLLHRTCVYLPIVVVTLLCFIMKPSIIGNSNSIRRSTFQRRLMNAKIGLCSVLTAMGLCEGFTHIIKSYVLRRRPNFYSLCNFDVATLQCTAPSKRIIESQASFPSGHSSLAFCGMTFILLLSCQMHIISMKKQQQQQREQGQRSSSSFFLFSWKIILSCFIPWSYATYVATSRIVDNWHHPSDVVAGSMLGIIISIVCYQAFFYFPPSSNDVPTSASSIGTDTETMVMGVLSPPSSSSSSSDVTNTNENYYKAKVH